MSKILTFARRSAVLASAGIVVTGGTAIYSAREREKIIPTNTLHTFPKKKDGPGQQVVVIGGGVVGITAAYKLALAGHSVVLIESRSEPGQECSYCAAGGMQRSNPVVDRDSWIAVSKCIFPSILGNESGGKLYKFFHISWYETLTDPFFLRWILTFTKTSLWPDSAQVSRQEEMLKFTKYAVEDMIRMMTDPKDNMSRISGFNSRGSFGVSYDQLAVETKADVGKGAALRNPTSSKMSLEPHKQVLGTTNVTTQEPSLRFQKEKPTSAKFEVEACSASSERFTRELASRCQNDLGVQFFYETTVKSIEMRYEEGSKPRIAHLRTNHGVLDIPDDAKVVVAAGAWTPRVLSLMNLYAPVYPLKGYAMSLSAKETLKADRSLGSNDLPSRIVSDKYMYTSRLGDEIRITSIGEFSGWNTQPSGIDVAFRNEAKRQFPQLEKAIDKAKTYCGHRPYVSDGILLLGPVSSHQNLFVSCGPGSNGWKLAMGSGEVIERLVSGQSLEQVSEALHFDASAVAPRDRVKHSPFFTNICRASWGV